MVTHASVSDAVLSACGHCTVLRCRAESVGESLKVCHMCRFCSENFVYADTESEGSKRSLSSVLAELA